MEQLRSPMLPHSNLCLRRYRQYSGAEEVDVEDEAVEGEEAVRIAFLSEWLLVADNSVAN
jgi:hypothetical protein